MNRIAQLLIFLLLFVLNGFAQPAKQEYNSLLWRISGNGLSAPSYIYGTIHLTDKRLFNFPDSLYYVLEHSDGFAAELDMGSLMPEIISSINDKKIYDDSLIIKMVRKEKLNLFKARLEKTVKKNLAEITFHDLSKLSSAVRNKILRKGDMTTIMDVYLYDIARKQGKWVGGIEDMEDQLTTPGREEEILSMISEITEDQTGVDKKLEWMIKIYLGQQLDSIDLTNQLWKGAEGAILINRNRKMARRMDSLMKLRTCLFAVGAAHLPGDSGVVKLLRARGFRVEAVSSSKRIEAGKYVYISKDIPWINAGIDGEWYSLMMPGKPEGIKSGESSNLLQSLLYYDLTRMNGYFTFGIALDSSKLRNPDSIYNALAENFGKQGKVVSSKTINVNRIPGKEFVIKGEESDMRLQAFLPGPALVMNLMAAFKYDSLFGNDAGHFFESFHVLKAPPGLPAVTWKNYPFEQHAFSIQFPVAYQKQKRNTAADTIWKTDVYLATDGKDNISCWMMVMDAKSGYYSDSDSVYFELMKQNILAGLKATDIKATSDRGNYKGYPMCRLNMKINYKNEPVLLKARLINRGSRRYYFYAVCQDNTAGEQKADAFLNSFDFLPLKSTAWSYHFSPKKDLSLWSPVSPGFQDAKDSNIATAGYMLYDSAAPASIVINKQYLSPYSWWKSDSAFFMDQSGRFVTKNDDSLRDFRLMLKDGTPQADFTVVVKDNHNLKKVRLLLNGDTLYSFFAFLPPDLIETEDYARLFNGIVLPVKKPSGYHLQAKTNRILRDLADGDSTAFAKAVDALGPALFTTADLPLLQKALLQPFRDFNAGNSGAFGKLEDKILELDDGTTLPFIKNNYASLKDSSQKLQYPFLNILLKLKSRESYGLFESIISGKLPSAGDAKIIQFSLLDSLELTAAIFPSLLKLSADTNFIKLLPRVTERLLDSGLVTTASIEPYLKYFYALSDREIARIKMEEPDYDYEAYHLIGFLSYFRNPAASQLLQKFLALPSILLKNQAARGLIKNGQPVEQRQLEKIAKDDYYRIELYEYLNDIKKENLFPVKYKTQQLLAQSELFQVASDDYTPDSIQFIAERTALYKGKPERFFIFKIVYHYEDDDYTRYLGVTGPYPKLPGKMIIRSDLTGFYNKEEYRGKEINRLLKAYLKEQEDYLAEDQ